MSKLGAAKTTLCTVAAALALTVTSHGVFAQSVRYDQKYVERLERAQNIQPLTGEVFGEAIGLSNGDTSFTYIDIDIEGNNSLPVQLIRRIQVEDRSRTQNSSLGGFGAGGDIVIPHMRGVFTNAGWQVSGGNPNARCTQPGAPPGLGNGIAAADY
ncbi:hypothetical protein [Luteimonas abyssi]|uniref:hypothetical protein n=1 Tax=Luteimonas abyssi TaxID=1247514 RepID=UPI0012F85A34|nr:hypothetical protein [Luteimonas abyssi]